MGFANLMKRAISRTYIISIYAPALCNKYRYLMDTAGATPANGKRTTYIPKRISIPEVEILGQANVASIELSRLNKSI